ncbi:hypothetical protein Tco_0785705 [Tanacetum coccineum]
MASEGIDSEAEYALSRQMQRGVAFSLARVVEARFANQGPTTTSATPNLKPPTSPILIIGGSQNKASDSPTAPEVAHEVAPHKLYETTTTTDTVAKIEETSEFYTSESEEHRTKPKKGRVMMMVLSGLYRRRQPSRSLSISTDPLEEPIAIHDWRVVLTAMQRILWDPGIKSAFQDDILRARWFRRSEECYALSLG